MSNDVMSLMNSKGNRGKMAFGWTAVFKVVIGRPIIIYWQMHWKWTEFFIFKSIKYLSFSVGGEKIYQEIWTKMLIKIEGIKNGIIVYGIRKFQIELKYILEVNKFFFASQKRANIQLIKGDLMVIWIPKNFTPVFFFVVVVWAFGKYE